MRKNILVVDDSALMRRLISDIIKSDERFVISDIASNGLEAFDLVTLYPQKYDAILLDINMPRMSGIEFLEQLNKLHIKHKIIMVSTLAKEGAKETIRCLELGAFDFVTKPESYIQAKNHSFRDKILKTLCIALHMEYQNYESENLEDKKDVIDTVLSTTRELKEITKKPITKQTFVRGMKGSQKIVALACSTGGPKALQQVIPQLPGNLDSPVIVVQHMPEGFTNSLAQRLNEMSKVKVKEAEHGEILKKGVVYIAKGGRQLRLVKNGEAHQIHITDEPPRNGLRPCADIMYESLLDANYDEITCVILTGMGADGTYGIKQLNDKKNIYVIAQDEATSIVYGMPKVIKEAGYVDEVVSISDVASSITKNVGVR